MLLKIARIGSLPFQEVACLRATSEKYILLDELIETTLHRAELETNNKILAKKWSQAEQQALRIFIDSVGKFFEKIDWRNQTVSLAHILLEDPWMQMIREAANNCLNQLQIHFSLEELLIDW